LSTKSPRNHRWVSAPDQDASALIRPASASAASSSSRCPCTSPTTYVACPSSCTPRQYARSRTTASDHHPGVHRLVRRRELDIAPQHPYQRGIPVHSAVLQLGDSRALPGGTGPLREAGL